MIEKILTVGLVVMLVLSGILVAVGGGVIDGGEVVLNETGFNTVDTEEIYEYWVPYVETVTGPSNTNSTVSFVVYEDSTTISIDTDNSGNTDMIFTGDRGDLLVWGRTSTSNEFPIEGAKITTNGLVDVFYHYTMMDYGAYEDGRFEYSILEKQFMGTEYLLPFTAKLTSIVSSTDDNHIELDTNNDGQPDQSTYLNEGDVWKPVSLPYGTRVTSKYPIENFEKPQ